MDMPSYTDEQLCHIWEACLSKLKATIPSVHYNSFISALTLKDFKDDVVYFTVPDPFFLTIIEKKYYDVIRNTLIEVTKRYLTVQFFEASKYDDQIEEQSKINDGSFETHLNKQYTFDSFIIGNNNRMACAAALAISDSPGTAYNPFFIYGQSGLGKTHLMHAIGNQILASDPTKKILYVSSETFTTEFVDAITHKKNDEFRNKYRNIDVLLIDDIQFLSKMERTQEEFFYTFNALYESKKQIVISCDTPLNKLEVLFLISLLLKLI